MLQWKDEFSVGDPAIDFEHRELIDAINEICDSLQRDKTQATDIQDMLAGVYSTVAAHFALEETTMQRHGYAEYEAHKQDHEKLLDEISELEEEFVKDSERGYQLLNERLSNWFAIHFSTFDARLHGKLGHH